MREDDAGTRILKARSAQSTWALVPIEKRVRCLQSLRRPIVQHMDEIVQTISDEVGKPPMDALVGDLMVTLE
jgi:acyl-CoA reductase-like NAD-dependent aldehyde dehydrogenase